MLNKKQRILKIFCDACIINLCIPRKIFLEKEAENLNIIFEIERNINITIDMTERTFDTQAREFVWINSQINLIDIQYATI